MRGRVWLDRRTRGKPRWTIIFTGPDGKQKRQTTAATTKKEAKALLQRKESEITRAKTYQIPLDMTFGRFVDEEYLSHSKAVNTAETYVRDESRAKSLKAEFGEMLLQDFTSRTIQRYVDRRANSFWGDAKNPRPYKPSSINKELMFLSAVFREAVKRGYLEKHPCRTVKPLPVRNERGRWLSPEEEQKVMSVASEHIRPMIVTAIHAGLRKGEVLGLRWSDVDFERRMLRVNFGKTHTVRHVPINRVLFAVLKEMSPDSSSWGTDRYVFVNAETGKPFVDFGNAYEGAVRRAKLSDVTFHTLRHTFASRLAQAGVPLLTISRLLGHSNMKQTMRYAHLAPSNLAEAVEVVANSSENVTRALQIHTPAVVLQQASVTR